GKGRLLFTINLGGFVGFNNGNVILKIKDSSDVVLNSPTITPSHQIESGYIALPKGSYSYSIQNTATSGGSSVNITYSLSCQQNYNFVYNKYDSLNRVIETGEYETNSLSSFSQTNADNISFPSSGTLISKKYFYDVASADTIASGQRNLKGKISYTESYREGSLAHRTYYSYDERGRIEWITHSGFNSYFAKIIYEYDLQGNIIKKGYIDPTLQNGSLFTAYTYDASGRLSTVKTSVNDNMSNATIESAHSYFASGKLKRLQHGNAQGMDYRYNERDWLTMINHQNLDALYQGVPQDPGGDGHNGIPGDKFGMIIDYNRIGHIGTSQNAQPQWNGNISWVMYNMYGVNFTGPAGTTSIVGRTFEYDDANRLRGANFGYWSSDQ